MRATHHLILGLLVVPLLLTWVDAAESAECFDQAVEINVYDTTNTSDLAQTLACSTTEELTVVWQGEVQLSSTLAVGNSTTLKITGVNGASMNGGGAIQLIRVTGGATLILTNVSLRGGWVPDGEGGSISANENSSVFLEDCSFIDNKAGTNGGEFDRERGIWVRSQSAVCVFGS